MESRILKWRGSTRLAMTASVLFAAACAPARSEPSRMPGMAQPTMAPPSPMNVRPMGPKPAWAPNIDPQMQAVIEQLGSYDPPPLTQLTAFQARNAPCPTKAVMDLLKKNGMPPMSPRVDVAHRVVPGPTPQGVVVRTYTPLGGTGPFPVIVYYHGGGWVIADLDTY